MDSEVHPAPYHINIYCNSCQVNPIRGIRLKCTTCKKYNLCLNCFQYDFNHEPSHRFEALKKCTLIQNPKSTAIPLTTTTKQKTNSTLTPTTTTTTPPYYFGTQFRPPTNNNTFDQFTLSDTITYNNKNNTNEAKKPGFTFGTNNKFTPLYSPDTNGNTMLVSGNHVVIPKNNNTTLTPFVYNSSSSSSSSSSSNNNFSGTGNFTSNTFTFGNNGPSFTPTYSFGMTSTSFSSANNNNNENTISMEMNDGSPF